jgi:hypothetical protein
LIKGHALYKNRRAIASSPIANRPSKIETTP